MSTEMFGNFAFEPRDQKLIFYLQNRLLKTDCQQEANERIRSRKKTWIAKWQQSIITQLSEAKIDDPNWFDSNADHTDHLNELSRPENHLKAGIILLEILFLEPYTLFQKSENRLKIQESQLRPNKDLWTSNLQQDAISLGYQADDVDRLTKSIRKTTNELAKRWQKLGVWGIGGLALGTLLFGTFTVPIALGIGAAASLSGAAAFTSGLAALGGIIGGGMFEGSIVMLAGGAIIGGTGGAITGGAAGYIAQRQLNINVIKLEVVLKEIVLQQRDFATYYKVLEEQRTIIHSYEVELDHLKINSEQHEEQIKQLETIVKLLKTSLERMQRGIDGTAA